jgi:hypothetical protein
MCVERGIRYRRDSMVEFVNKHLCVKWDLCTSSNFTYDEYTWILNAVLNRKLKVIHFNRAYVGIAYYFQ